MDKIIIKDLEVFANHGVFPEENVLGQKFVVSATLFTDTRKSGLTDDLTCSIHYGEVAQQIDTFLRTNTYKLLETALESLARELLLTRPLLQAVTLEVKKPWAPVRLPLDTVSVEITRSWHIAYVALGSNMGDKEAYLNLGVNHLKEHADIQVKRVSSFYETEPYGVTDQDTFLNGCMEIRTLLSPEELLDVLQEGEQKAGRKRLIHWGPRTLDLDLLFYDKELIDTERLIVPHPEIPKRDFVLKPMNEIAPWFRHPVSNQTIAQLWQEWQSANKKENQKRNQKNNLEYAFKELFKISFEEIQEIPMNDVKVVFQGVKGAYSNAALMQFFGNGMNIESYNVKTFSDAMAEVSEGRADYAVLPIENSTAGMVGDVYDLLMEYNNIIIAETYLKVQHCLLGLPEATIEDIQTVYSHPQGLMQCNHYLEYHKDWQKISELNTAVSAMKVVEMGDKTQAAIASRYAGELYGLSVLEEGINDNKENTTRFIIVTKKKQYKAGAKKLTICFEVPHESGSLYNILAHFIFFDLNMTKIESRPLPGRNWEYRFYVDVEGNLSEPAVRNALMGIEKESNQLRILGNY